MSAPSTRTRSPFVLEPLEARDVPAAYGFDATLFNQASPAAVTASLPPSVVDVDIRRASGSAAPAVSAGTTTVAPPITTVSRAALFDIDTGSMAPPAVVPAPSFATASRLASNPDLDRVVQPATGVAGIAVSVDWQVMPEFGRAFFASGPTVLAVQDPTPAPPITNTTAFVSDRLASSDGLDAPTAAGFATGQTRSNLIASGPPMQAATHTAPAAPAIDAPSWADVHAFLDSL